MESDDKSRCEEQGGGLTTLASALVKYLALDGEPDSTESQGNDFALTGSRALVGEPPSTSSLSLTAGAERQVAVVRLRTLQVASMYENLVLSYL